MLGIRDVQNLCQIDAYRISCIQNDMRMTGLGKCANPDCEIEFKRLGTGKIYSSPVKQPQDWGLPAHNRQKVVWLCSRCAMSHRVIFDQQRCQVLVVHNERVHKRSA